MAAFRRNHWPLCLGFRNFRCLQLHRVLHAITCARPKRIEGGACGSVLVRDRRWSQANLLPPDKQAGAAMAARTNRTVAGAMFALFGSVGGQPAEAIAQSVHFIAAPTAGPTPLIVRFCASAGITIDFGDRTSSGMQGARDGDCPAGLSYFVSHTYTAPGIYHLRGFPCPSSMLHPECGDAAGQASSVTVTVTGAS